MSFGEGDLHERVEQLERENAELRELVGDMLRWMPCPKPCRFCERYVYPEGCEFALRFRKLGIGVEG